MRKSARKPPWLSAFWVNRDFRYTQEQAQAILDALPANQYGTAVVQSIQELAREYVSERRNEEDKPKPGRVTAQLRELDTRLSHLCDCLAGLDDSTLEALEAALQSEHPIEVMIADLKASLERLQTLTWAAAREYNPHGAPARSEPIRVFVAQLYELWVSCGNRPPPGTPRYTAVRRSGRGYRRGHTPRPRCSRPFHSIP